MFLREQQTDTKGKLQFSGPPAICLLLVAVTLTVYWPVLRYDFVNYDDPAYIASNVHVRTGLTLPNVAWTFSTVQTANWHPLTWLSLMLDVELFGKGPFGPHLTNLLLHLANTVLVFLLFRRLTAATWRSAFVAALFAWHPLHVESVAWIAERKDVLSTFFGLWALLFYAGYAQNKKTLNPQHSTINYTLALLFFALGLMSKPMLVTLPLVMLLLDWWPLQRIADCGLRIADSKSSARSAVGSPLHKFNRLLVEKWPFFLLSAISCVVTFIVQQKSGAMPSLMKISLAGRIENAFVSYARYLGKTFWPVNLAVLYPHPGHWDAGLVVFSLLLVAGLSVAAVRVGRRFPFVFTGWFWFFGTLIPVIGLVQVGNQSMADRYSYVPLIGVFIILAWGMGESCVNRRLPRQLMVMAALFLLVASALRTRDQTGNWQNSGTLFRHALAVTRNNYIAYNNLGTYLSQMGQETNAMDCYTKSLQINPDNSDALYNFGNGLARFGNLDGAMEYYRRVLQIAPARTDALNNLGMALINHKQYAEAMTNFEKALQVNPDFASAHNNLATVLFFEQRFDEAARHCREALRLQPDNPLFYNSLGDVLVKQGQTAEAVRCYQEALRLYPGYPKIRAKLQALGAPVSN